MKRYFYILISLTLVLATVYSCNEKADDAKDFDVQFNVPESVTLEENYTDMTFKVLFKKSPAKSDVLVLTDPAERHTIVRSRSYLMTRSPFPYIKEYIRGIMP